MLRFIVRRAIIAVFTMAAISVVAFFIIELPPGDYLTSYAATLAEQGDILSEERLEQMRVAYGLGEPLPTRYFKWISAIVLRGDFGRSLEWRIPVNQIIWNRIGFTILINISTIIFVWSVAIPIGVYSATRQYSPGDYIATFFGFLGLAIPNFMLALVLMWIGFSVFDQHVGGLFSPEYRDAPWDLNKFIDLLNHLWIPMVVVGTAGTAGLIRTMRANMLDEITQPYVETARAKGLAEWRLIWKYPVRVALNPFISTIGYALPELVGGVVIVAVVLNLPTIGPILLRSLLSQDMFLAGAIILIVSVLTIIGTLISDILLAIIDPRIRLE